jgi:PD-(D/E)XK nuclease superfamily
VQIPVPPDVIPLTRISPSQYEAGRACKARLAWAAAGRRNELPDHPKALLGICFHAVVEAAATGRLQSGDEELIGVAARDMFDQLATSAYGRAHPLVRFKYESVEVLPYYYLFRERAVLMARRVVERTRPPASAAVSDAGPSRRLVEKELSSRDGLLLGRPDYVDAQAREILDYKTGASEDDAAAMSPAEARQLRLYVHLALENDVPVSHVVIVRPGGQRAEAEVTKSQADGEGHKAGELLRQFNQIAGRPFEAVAEPSADTCKFCSCIPFCEPFWRVADPSWLENCGTHVEGRTSAITESQVQGNPVLTFHLDVSRGTVDAQEAFVEQVPQSWMTAGGGAIPKIADVLRIVHGRATLPVAAPVIHVDRTLTSLWAVPEQKATAPGPLKRNGQSHARTTQSHDVPDPQQGHAARADDSPIASRARATVPQACTRAAWPTGPRVRQCKSDRVRRRRLLARLEVPPVAS